MYVGPVEDRHAAGLADFFRASWGEDASAESVAEWRAREAAGNPAQPGVEPPKWVFTRDDVVLGYLGTIPDRFVADGRPFEAYWLKGFWVSPEFRSGPVGFEMLRHAVEALEATAVSTVAPEARRLFEAQGLEPRGVLFNRLRLLRPGRVLGRVSPDVVASVPAAVRVGVRALQATRTAGLAGGVLEGLLRAGAAVRGRPSGGLRTTRGWDDLPDRALDALWSEFAGSVGGATVRDGAMVRWRYGDPARYEAVGVWAGERLRGWAVIRVPSRATSGRLQGVSVASLSDLLFPVDDPAVGCAVVRAAERVAAALDADAVLCSGSHPALADVLARRSFLPLPGNVHFMARNDEARSFPRPFESWWLTRGDAQSDGAF